MDWKAIRRRNNGSRGWQGKDPIHNGRDSLEDKKLKKELMKMMMEDHLRETHKFLPEDMAEKLTFRWMDDEGNEEIREL